jgi:hypothetical protein
MYKEIDGEQLFMRILSTSKFNEWLGISSGR